MDAIRRTALARPVLYKFFVLAAEHLNEVWRKQRKESESHLFSAYHGETEIAMLVLTRKLDEAIRIGDDIKITILRVKGNTVRIGIEAPREVRVVRDELDAESSTKAQAPTIKRTVTAVGTGDSGRTRSTAPSAVAPAAHFDLLECEGAEGEDSLADEDAAVVATVVDSPQPSTSRLFVGKLRVETANNRVGEHERGDQAAPLRAFLRSSLKLQAAG